MVGPREYCDRASAAISEPGFEKIEREMKLTSTTATPREVLDRLSLRGAGNRALRGLHNAHWLVHRGSQKMILRRYWARRTLGYVAWELELLERLSRAGWPVPRVAAGPIEAAHHVWCAFTYLKGRRRSPRTLAGARNEQLERGRLLAELHQDLARWTDLGQREKWVRSEEVFIRNDDGPTLKHILEALSGQRPEEAKILMWHADRAHARLTELKAEDLNATIIHGDFAPWNIRYEKGKLSGVLDFDLSHLNHRVADFALSWRGKHDQVVFGYNEVDPLSDTEWELLTPVWWAWCLAGARDQLIRDPESNLEWVLTHIQRRTPLTSL